jgi:hypothetical protein
MDYDKNVKIMRYLNKLTKETIKGIRSSLKSNFFWKKKNKATIKKLQSGKIAVKIEKK